MLPYGHMVLLLNDMAGLMSNINHNIIYDVKTHMISFPAREYLSTIML